MLTFIRMLLALLERIHKPAAFRLTSFLISYPQTGPANERDKTFMQEAHRIEFKRNNKNNGKCKRVALSWGEGPLVILVHGWEGRSTQMSVLAKHLAASGFQAVALDITAHGESNGRKVSFRDYIDDIDALIKYLGKDVHAMLGHSAGGLCMMAAREMLNLEANHYVTISSPSAPFPLIDVVRRRLKVSEPVIDMIKAKVAKNFDCNWAELERGKAFKQLRNDEQLLLVYDTSDNMVDHSQSDVIQNIWPDAKVYKSDGLGHFKPLWAEDVIERVSQFLNQSKPV